MVAGFNKPTDGEVRLQTRITQPGPDRMVFSRTTLSTLDDRFENI